ncbi:MAG: SWIM zinc finger family protein, partial [Chloroflexi bacterium]|nr:SWIM zinc finger family protein [Chloroflexota bacterium]
MNRIRLTESMIRAATTPESFQRGQSYFNQGAISNAAIQSNVLSGDCEGTQSPYYHVRVELDDAGIRFANCTCPYEFGGFCKHIVALLLAYIHNPKEFTARESPNELLAGLSRDDLLALMTKLIERQPDLYDWVQAAIAAPSPDKSKKTRRKKVDADVYRRQVRNILHRLDGMRMSEAYWHVGGLANELRGVKDNAIKFLEQDDAETALGILLALLEEAHDAFDYIDDSNGELGACLDEMGLPLAEAILSLELSAVERERLVQQLQKLDRRLSDYGVEGAASIALQATRYGWDEIPSHPHVAVRDDEDAEDTDEEDEEYAAYHESQSWDAPIGDLTEAKLNVLDRQGKTDEYLALCKKEGKHLRFVLKLCELGRMTEAIGFAQKHLTAASEALQLAQKLRELNRVEESIVIAERGLELAPSRAGLGAWLGPIEESRGRTREAFDAFFATFAEMPSLETYKTLKRLAEPAWHKTQAQVMGALNKSHNHQVLAEVYLFEEEWDEAIQVADKRDVWYTVIATVADGVIEHRPEWVIRVSIKQAEHLIGKTQSKYYRDAAEWLKRT